MKKVVFVLALCVPFWGFSQITVERSAIKVIQTPDAKSIATAPPLCVVDGAVFSFVDKAAFDEKLKSIDPETIASIDVLKGQKAIDTFGEKGVNGVIVITSKKATAKRD